MQLGLSLIPVLPLLLLPFFFIFIIIVFPIWVLGLAIVGSAFVIVQGIDFVARTTRLGSAERLVVPVHGAFRWVLTFGGIARPGKSKQL